RMEDNGLDHTEDRRVRADTERQGRDSDRREARTLAKRPRRVANVLGQRFRHSLPQCIYDREGYNVGVKLLFLPLALVSLALAAHRPVPTPTSKTGNANVELSATLYVDKESIQKLLGSDLGGYYVVVDVRLAPKNSEKVKIFRDDFQLRTDRDGEK